MKHKGVAGLLVCAALAAPSAARAGSVWTTEGGSCRIERPARAAYDAIGISQLSAHALVLRSGKAPFHHKCWLANQLAWNFEYEAGKAVREQLPVAHEVRTVGTDDNEVFRLPPLEWSVSYSHEAVEESEVGEVTGERFRVSFTAGHVTAAVQVRVRFP